MYVCMYVASLIWDHDLNEKCSRITYEYLKEHNWVLNCSQSKIGKKISWFIRSYKYVRTTYVNAVYSLHQHALNFDKTSAKALSFSHSCWLAQLSN